MPPRSSPGIAQGLTHRGINLQEARACGLHLALAYSAPVEHDAERRFALAQRPHISDARKDRRNGTLPEQAVGHGDALDLPIIRFDDVDVFSPLAAAGRREWLAGVE